MLGQDLRGVVAVAGGGLEGVGDPHVDAGPTQRRHVVGDDLAHEGVGEAERAGAVGQRRGGGGPSRGRGRRARPRRPGRRRTSGSSSTRARRRPPPAAAGRWARAAAVRRRTTSRTLDGTSPPADTAPSDRSGSRSASTRCASSVAKNGLPSARSWMARHRRSRSFRRGGRAPRSGGGTGPQRHPAGRRDPRQRGEGLDDGVVAAHLELRARCRPAGRAGRRSRAAYVSSSSDGRSAHWRSSSTTTRGVSAARRTAGGSRPRAPGTGCGRPARRRRCRRVRAASPARGGARRPTRATRARTTGSHGQSAGCPRTCGPSGRPPRRGDGPRRSAPPAGGSCRCPARPRPATRAACALVQSGDGLPQLDLAADEDGAGRGRAVVGRRRRRRGTWAAAGTGDVAGSSVSAVSCARMAASSSTSGRPGSMPSWLRSVRRASSRMRSASAWRPDR